MKRMAAAAVLAVLIIVLAVWGRLSVDRNISAVEGLLTAAYNSAKAGDLEAAAKYAAAAEQRLVSCEGYLSVFIDHSLIYELGVSVSRLPLVVRSEHTEDFLAECAAARTMVTHVLRADRPALTNIL